MLVSTAELMETRGREGVIAFNVITLEHAQGILAGAERAEAPVILQLSENAIRYHGSPVPISAAVAALAHESGARVALQLDHITQESLAIRTAALGFSSVMFDAAASPDDENVARTRAVADEVREQGIYVEAELGEIGGKGGAHTPGVRTDPGDAADFVARTGVNALAVAVGSSHAMTSATARLDVALIETIAGRVPVPLVLHGSSGVPNEDIREAIAAGMAKVNIGTALNVAFTGAVRRHLAEHGGVDPRPYLRDARAAVAHEVHERLLALRLDRGGR
ncbi:MAG: class II fructose-bisphosphate aldolase [Microbacterium sp.]